MIDVSDHLRMFDELLDTLEFDSQLWVQVAEERGRVLRRFFVNSQYISQEYTEPTSVMDLVLDA